MKLIIIMLGMIFPALIFAQKTTGPVTVTPEMQLSIKKDIEKDVVKLKERLEKNKAPKEVIEFSIDTFRVEEIMGRWIDLDNSDAGMQNAGYEAAKQYDDLLNKYYKKLLTVLNNEDKKMLVQAQKAWITFRDSEMKLIGIVGKEEYSGGGTIQFIIESAEYVGMIRKRTTEIFNHYTRASQIN